MSFFFCCKTFRASVSRCVQIHFYFYNSINIDSDINKTTIPYIFRQRLYETIIP